jgi:hypothetical protein
MGRLDEVIEIKGEQEVKYPRVGVFKDVVDATGASVVLPSICQDRQDTTCQEDTEKPSFPQE